ncbi:iron ABC transporter substrate-binding protein [Nocardioides sp. JQ2195]|uniref:iron ABC transporter substrate-binding protein n=1 Tax=Nocardioides sp. JQ2195 TaxID=2592334 RepID=UPI00143ECD49|nr:iron ABC transporter substrate-binding protein [Nocardioides sp. JQ2195]QIX25432.1 iron ABC transporter substrate-binding protein [Nocardioides sp. JQ2195]
MKTRSIALAVPVLMLSGLLSSCSEDDGPSITVYNAQHEELLEELAPIFEEETGIDVKLRNGKDFELANQIVTEGDASPADVFLTENSPAMSLVESEGLFAPLAEETLALTPKQYRPESGNWTGFAARSTVVMYNKDDIAPEDLPKSILDFADPQWKGKVSFSPTGADFQAIVSAVLQLEGEAATKEWLAGLAANGEVYDGNNIVMQSVNDGETPTGIAYHYYWYRDQKESGENSSSTELHFFGNQDPGAFVSISGAGVLESSDKQDDAQAFVKFLVDKVGQQALADSYALEYPLNPDVQLEPLVKPFSELEPPTVDVSALNGPKVIELMQDAGLI